MTSAPATSPPDAAASATRRSPPPRMPPSPPPQILRRRPWRRTSRMPPPASAPLVWGASLVLLLLLSSDSSPSPSAAAAEERFGAYGLEGGARRIRREVAHGVPRDLQEDAASSSSSSNSALSTPLDGTNGSFGTMFDVSSTDPRGSPVLVRTLALHVNVASADCPVRLYTKEGTHRGYETDPSAWTLIYDGTMQCRGFQVPSVVPAVLMSGPDSLVSSLPGGADGPNSALRIPAGGTRAFYAHLSSPNLRYTNAKDADEMTGADRNVYVRAGTGMGGYFDLPYSPRHWNGVLYYTAEEGEEAAAAAAAAADAGQGCEGELMTVFNDTIGSYGSMFNLRIPPTTASASDGVVITGMDLYTDVTVLVDFEVYTKEGTFADAVMDLSRWTLLAAGRTTGAGSFAGTPIPPEMWFRPLTMMPGETRGFYATFKTPDMRYTDTDLQMGDVFRGDDAVQIEVGVGVAEYPLGKTFYGPRVWNGRVHYRTLGDGAQCAPTTPPTVRPIALTAPPTASPTIPKFRSTVIEYAFLIEHPANLGQTRLFGEVDDVVRGSVERMLADVEALSRYAAVFGLRLEEAESALGGGGENDNNCIPQDPSKLCTPLNVEVTLTHMSDLESQAVRYELLHGAHRVVSDLESSGMLRVRYIGDEALTTAIIVTLVGVPPQEMGIGEAEHFQRAARRFLNGRFGVGGEEVVEVLTVRVEKQEVYVGGGTAMSGDDRGGGLVRRLLRGLLGRELPTSSAAASVDITTTVTGEHRPPPPVKFDELVEDSIDRGGDDFVEELAESDGDGSSGYFEEVEEVSARPAPTAAPTPAPTSAPTAAAAVIAAAQQGQGGPTEDGPANVLIMAMAGLAAIGVGIGGYLFWRNRKKKSAAGKGDAEAYCPEEGMRVVEKLNSRGCDEDRYDDEQGDMYDEDPYGAGPHRDPYSEPPPRGARNDPYQHHSPHRQERGGMSPCSPTGTVSTNSKSTHRSSGTPGARPMREMVLKDEGGGYGGGGADADADFDTGTIGSPSRSVASAPANRGGVGGGRAAVQRDMRRTEEDYVARARRKAREDSMSVSSGARSAPYGPGGRYPARRSSSGGGGGGMRDDASFQLAPHYSPRRPRSRSPYHNRANVDVQRRRSSNESSSSQPRSHRLADVQRRRNSNGSSSHHSSASSLPRFAHHRHAGSGEVSRGAAARETPHDGAGGEGMSPSRAHERRSSLDDFRESARYEVGEEDLRGGGGGAAAARRDDPRRDFALSGGASPRSGGGASRGGAPLETEGLRVELDNDGVGADGKPQVISFSYLPSEGGLGGSWDDERE